MELSEGQFKGFSRKTLEFMKGLAANNNKDWFEAHRRDYQEYLLYPMQDLVADLSGFMVTLDPYLEVTPVVDKTISRIRRDTRFSRDKSPYRSNLWLAFKRPSKSWTEYPSFFFEIFPASYRYGMGFYWARRDTMLQLRESIDGNSQQFFKAIAFYSGDQPFKVEGERYKRILKAGQPPEIQEWYQRKNLVLICNRPVDDRLFSPQLAEDLRSGFGVLAPLYNFLWKLCGG